MENVERKPVEVAVEVTESGIEGTAGGRHLYGADTFERVAGTVEIGGLIFQKGVEYRTKNYSFFSFVDGNRFVSDAKVGQMVASFLDIGNQPGCPLFVYRNSDGTHAIIADGQTRFNAAVEVNDWVYFIVGDRIGLKMIIKLNSTSRNWFENDNQIKLY